MALQAFTHGIRQWAERTERVWAERRAGYQTMLFILQFLTLALAIVHLAFGEVPKTATLFTYALLLEGVLALAWLLHRFAPAFMRRRRDAYALAISVALLLSAIAVTLPLTFALKNWLVLGLLAVAGIPLWIHVADSSNATSLLRGKEVVTELLIAAATIWLLLFSSEDWFAPLRSLWVIVFFVAVFAFLSLPAPKWLARFFSLFVCVGITFVLFSLTTRLTDIAAVHHYSYFLGPVVEHLYGNRYPLSDLYTQYGGGLTIGLSAYFRLVGFVGPEPMLVLLKLLTVLECIAMYFIASSLFHSRRLAALAVAMVLTFHTGALGSMYFALPSIGVLRFGWIYLVLLLLTLQKDSPRFPRLLTHWGVPLITAIATVWSFENIVYTLAPIAAWALLTLDRRSLKHFARRFATCLVAVGLLYTLPPLLAGKPVDFTLYYKYPLLYAQGFGLVSVYERPAAWMLAVVLLLFPLTLHLSGSKQDGRVLLLSFYGLAIFTYFIARATALNFPPVSIPVIFLSLHFAATSSWPRKLIISAVAAVFLVPVTTFELARGGQSLSLAEWRLLDPLSSRFAFSEANFRKEHCSDSMQQLRGYFFHGTLPLLSLREDGYLIHACLRVGNTYGLDPYSAATINLRIASQILDAIIASHPPFLLGQPSTYFLPNYNPDAIFLLREALRFTHAEKIRSFNVNGELVSVYRLP